MEWDQLVLLEQFDDDDNFLNVPWGDFVITVAASGRRNASGDLSRLGDARPYPTEMNPIHTLPVAFLCFAAAISIGCTEQPQKSSSLKNLPTTSEEPESHPTAKLSSSDANEGISWVEHIAEKPIGEIAISLPPTAIVVATVLGVSNDAPTYGRPPTIEFSVTRKLLNAAVPDKIEVIWEPPPHDVDYNNVQDEPRYIQWAQTPLSCPKNEERFLLLLVDTQTEIDGPPIFSCPTIGRYPNTKENIQKVIGALDAAKQD